jgi:hypothetical protein
MQIMASVFFLQHHEVKITGHYMKNLGQMNELAWLSILVQMHALQVLLKTIPLQINGHSTSEVLQCTQSFATSLTSHFR